jgi:hypothetical protein
MPIWVNLSIFETYYVSIMIKTDKQVYFNQVKGVIDELNDSDTFCNITLSVGHNITRQVNLVAKKELFQDICAKYKIGEWVGFKFFISSRFKHGRWYTMANILEVIE